jgi:hypothetical protein
MRALLPAARSSAGRGAQSLCVAPTRLPPRAPAAKTAAHLDRHADLVQLDAVKLGGVALDRGVALLAHLGDDRLDLAWWGWGWGWAWEEGQRHAAGGALGRACCEAGRHWRPGPRPGRAAARAGRARRGAARRLRRRAPVAAPRRPPRAPRRRRRAPYGLPPRPARKCAPPAAPQARPPSSGWTRSRCAAAPAAARSPEGSGSPRTRS